MQFTHLGAELDKITLTRCIWIESGGCQLLHQEMLAQCCLSRRGQSVAVAVAFWWKAWSYTSQTPPLNWRWNQRSLKGVPSFTQCRKKVVKTMATVVKALVQLVMSLRHQRYCSFRRHEHKQLWFRLRARQMSGQGILTTERKRPTLSHHTTGLAGLKPRARKTKWGISTAQQIWQRGSIDDKVGPAACKTWA